MVPAGNRGDVQSHLASAEDLLVRIQIVGPRHEYARFPTEVAGVALRYSDLPAGVALCIPTREAFVAMKVAAFEDRAQARVISSTWGPSPRPAPSTHPPSRCCAASGGMPRWGGTTTTREVPRQESGRPSWPIDPATG